MLQHLLYKAGTVLMTRTPKWSRLWAWSMSVASRRGIKRATFAVARKLAVISSSPGAMTADDLRALRKRLAMTQAQPAEALDLSPSTISIYEGARSPPCSKSAIPRVVVLACQALVAKDQRDWSVID